MRTATRQAALAAACVLCRPGRQGNSVAQRWGLVVQQSWFHPTLSVSAVGLLWRYSESEEMICVCVAGVGGLPSCITVAQEPLRSVRSIPLPSFDLFVQDGGHYPSNSCMDPLFL